MLNPKREEELLRGGSRRAERAAAVQPATEPELDLPAEPEPPEADVSRWWLTIPLIFGLILGMAMFDNRAALTPGLSRSPTRLAEARRGDMERTLRISGSVAAKTSVSIRAPRIRGRGGGGGSLTLIRLAAAGTEVRKGEVIAELDRRKQLDQIDNQEARIVQQDATIRRVQANQSITVANYDLKLRRARAAVEKARLDVRTAEVKSQIQAEILLNNVRQVEADLAQLEKEIGLAVDSRAARTRQEEIDRAQLVIDLERAQVNVDKMLMRAPTDGMAVMMTNSRGGGDFSEVSNGDQLRSGSYFMQVVDVSEMILEAGINQVDSQSMRVGQRARIKLDAYPDAEFEGRLVAVGALATASTGGGGGGRGRLSRGGGGGGFIRELTAKFAIDSRDKRLIPDMSASADIMLEQKKNTLIVPRAAVGRDEEGAFLWVRQDDGRFRRRDVRVGLINDVEAEILEGLDAGEIVAAEPPNELETVDRPQAAALR